MSYLKDKIRMVNSLTGGKHGCSDESAEWDTCKKCPLNAVGDFNCYGLENLHPEQAEKIVADWCKKNPIKTRKMQFLEIFPNANPERISLGDLDSTECNPSTLAGCFRYAWYGNCSKCREAYWNEEI